MSADEIKRWRFRVENWDDESWYLDTTGGVDGDDPAAEFVGTSHDARDEGDRRCELWEAATGQLAARITRESLGAPNT